MRRAFSAQIPPLVPLAGLAGEEATLCIGTPSSEEIWRADCREITRSGERLLALNGAACGPPVARAGDDVSAECTSPDGASVVLDGRASSDPKTEQGDGLSLSWFVNRGTPEERSLGSGAVVHPTLPLGIHRITLEASDSFGDVSSDEVLAGVHDTQPPILSLTLDPVLLWPPNHRLVPVSLEVVSTDMCDPSPQVFPMSISSSEPDDAPGDGDGTTQGDIQTSPGAEEGQVLLRAERSGSGRGRAYLVTVRASDHSGNSSSVNAGALVPHDRDGVTEPVSLIVTRGGPGSSTALEWSLVGGADFYNVLRGLLSDVSRYGALTILNQVECIASGSAETRLSGPALDNDPPPGDAYFYLVEFHDRVLSGYGTAGGTEILIGSGTGCQGR